MNQFTLLVIILVVFIYYGGSNVPKVLKDNKELLLGVVVGLVLCSFLGMRLEGVTGGENGAAGGNGTAVLSDTIMNTETDPSESIENTPALKNGKRS